MASNSLLPELAIVVLGVAIAAGSLLAFIFVAHSSVSQFRNLAIAFYVLASVVLFIAAARHLPMSASMRAAASIAVMFTAIYQFMGYFLFSGLVKGVEAFSGDHLARLVIGLLLMIAWYVFLSVSAYLTVSRWRRSGISYWFT